MSGNVTGTPITMVTLVELIVASIAAESLSGVNLGGADVTPSDTGTQVTLASAFAARLPLTGGTITGTLNSSASGTSAQTSTSLPTLDFLGSTINFQRTVQTGAPTFSGVRAFLDIYSSGYSNYGYGFATVPAFQAIATSHAGSNPGVGALVGTLYSQGTTSGYLAPDVAVTGTVVQSLGGTNSTWNFAGQNQDNTGLTNHPFQYGIESDLLNNGPDTTASAYNPTLANRIGMLLANKQNPVNAYASNSAVARGTLISQTVSGTAYVFICTTAGTTGASPPTWNATYGHTVTDGTVVWTTGVAYNNITGVGLLVSSATANSSHNTGIAINGYINNAAIDLSLINLAGPSANAGPAAIRLAQNHPIDFTGNGTLAGQNLHTLFYSSYISALAYQAQGTTVLTLDDTGKLTISASAVVGGTNLFGVSTGYSTSGLTIGRNLSGSGEIDLITASGGCAFYAGASGVISSPYLVASSTGLTSVGTIQGSGYTVGASGPTITSGSAAPTATQPKGSLYTRTSGGVGTTLYVSQGGGTWNAVAGV